MNNHIKQTINGHAFELKEPADFSFLNQYGTVFSVFDQNDSGNISFGVVDKKGEKVFIKVAGAKTVGYSGKVENAIQTLKKSVDIYLDLKHKRLIELQEARTYKQLFYVVFKWHEGECLFDHWNFDYYQRHPEILTPMEKFKQLSQAEKLTIADQIVDFLVYVESKNYVPVDFYDGSIMIDFESKVLTICDIDLFEKNPHKNHIGEDYWGTKRMKAPEEYQLNSPIDSRTTVFTIGALFSNLFGTYTTEILQLIYEKNQFIPLNKEEWSLPEKLFPIVLKAVSLNREERYPSVATFTLEWKKAH
ncbi:protein kinase domain-containing protein [Marinilactibacillus kalidii]|uniref:protein kinase domain-containing protein n=1 Tax=Marinilactibacillus kalidii TaxID=2820274 RepID=UPI001ABE01F4|nr:protein kinase [Marinilactibacillus kalidii]